MALADELDDAALERLMALTMQDEDDAEDGTMAYGTISLPAKPADTKPPVAVEEEAATMHLGQVPTFVINTPAQPSLAINKQPAFVVDLTPAHEAEIVRDAVSFQSALLVRCIDRIEADELYHELSQFLSVGGETPAARERAAMQVELEQLRSQLAVAREAAEAEVATEKAAANARVASAEARAAHAKAAADVAVARAEAEAKATADAWHKEAAEGRKAAALAALGPQANRIRGNQESACAEEPVEEMKPPAQVFDFSGMEDSGAATAEDTVTDDGRVGSVGSKVTKVLRSLSFGKRGRKK